tara:strand:+ start:1061 stop:1876 length:816 start_codon:yes stop_codon:yes gene_type:complete
MLYSDNAMIDEVLSFHAVSLVRGQNELLCGIDLQLASGQMLALLGPNGAGKTSLLNCVNGIKDYSGTIMLHGRSVLDFNLKQRAKILALLPQQSALSFPFSVSEIVMLGRYSHRTGNRIDCAITDRLLDLMHLTALAGRPYTSLSGGEKQRVQLARVLSQLVLTEDLALHRGSVLLLDEPVSSLDLLHQSSLMKVLKQLCDTGLAVAVVLHDLNLAAAYADQCALLKKGKLIASGTVEEVMTAPLIKQAYGIDVDIILHPKTAKPLVIRDH